MAYNKAREEKKWRLWKEAEENVEHQIKCTKKIKLNAKRNNVKFNSIQFI